MSKPRSVIPIKFAVFRDSEPAEVALSFPAEADIISTTRWRVPSLNDQAMRSRASDSREFALLAAKRWRHYRDTDTAVYSVAELQSRISSEPEGEFCFNLKVTADWFSGILGGAMLRRTWHHHLALDFLFVHPRIASRLVDVRSVGAQLLHGMCILADGLGCQRIWGEATQESAPFYRRYLKQPVDDQFAIDAKEIAQMASALEAERIR